MKEMRAKLLDPKPEIPLLGYSIVALMDTARSIRSPNWNCQRVNRSWGNTSRLCNLQPVIKSKMDVLEEGIDGLTLDDFGGRHSLPHPDTER